ncbi:hypothetical protein D3C85_1826060 [compost metagenome]
MRGFQYRRDRGNERSAIAARGRIGQRPGQVAQGLVVPVERAGLQQRHRIVQAEALRDVRKVGVYCQRR